MAQRLFLKENDEPVELPAKLKDFRGEEREIVRIEQEASPGRSGKLLLSDGQIRYPMVFDAYLATKPGRPPQHQED